MSAKRPKLLKPLEPTPPPKKRPAGSMAKPSPARSTQHNHARRTKADGTKIPDELKIKFLENLAQCGNVTRAAESVAVSRVYFYLLAQENEEFKEKMNQARALGIEWMEDEASRRAFNGYDEPVFQQGVQVGTVRKFSDQLAMFLLRGNKPDKFKERVANENVNVQLERGPYSKLTDEEIDAEIKRRLG